MPQFQLTAPDGRMVTVEGAEPPSDADADEIFAGIPAKAEKPPLASMEGLFGGVDGIDKWLGPADSGALNASLANSTDAKAAKIRAANVAFMAGQYGVDAGEVAAKLPVYRHNYAKDVLGIAEPLDDNAFYAKVGAHITTEKAQGQMLGQLAGTLFDAARTGAPFTKTYEAFREANLENAGYVKGRDEYYRQVAQNQWAFFRTNAIRLSAPIERLSAHMQSFKGKRAYEGDAATIAEREDIITMLAGLSEQDREIVMDFASGAASAQTDAQKEEGFASKLGSKFSRGVGAFTQSLLDVTERTTGGVIDAIDNVEEGRPAIEQMERPKGGVDFLTKSQGPIAKDLKFTGKLGPVESVIADRQRIERGITQRIIGEVDPLRAGGWLSQGILDAAESMPRMMASLSGPGIALNLAATKQDIRGRYEDQGLSAGDADMLSNIAAVPYVALDFVSAKMAFRGKLPGLERFLTAPVASAGRLAGRAAFVAGAQTVEQFGQEVLQDLTEPAVQSVASALSESVPEVNWTEQLSFLKASAPETLAAVLPLVLIGTGTATFKDRAYGREYLKNREALRAVGFSEEVATEIIEAPTPEQAGAIMRQGWEERKVGPEQQEFVKELNGRAIAQREEMGYQFSDAQKALLEKYPTEFNSIPPNQIPVEIQKADGTVYPAVMGGYWELGDQDFRPSIGRYLDGSWSHGMPREGETILTPLPTPMQWQAGVRDASDVEQVSAEQVQPAQETDIGIPTSEAVQPAIEVKPVVTKVPDVGYVVTDKNTGAPLGSAPTAEGAAQIVQDVKAEMSMDGSPTATKNAVTDAERVKRGLPKAMAAGKREFGEVWDQATRIIDQNANAGDQLVKVLEQRPRATTDLENAILLHRQIELQNEFDKLAAEQQAAQQSGDEGDIARTNEALKEVSDKLLQLYTVERTAGTETGRGLAARRMLANENYSLARMVTQRRVANEGRELTKKQLAETEKFQQKIAALEKELADYKERLTEEQAAKPARERKDKPPKPREPREPRQQGKAMAFLSKQATEARARLKERLMNVNSGVDPTVIADLAIVGAEYVAKGVRDFSKWSAAMVKEFGDRLTPFLAEIYDRAKEIKKLQDIEARADARIAELERQIRDEEVFTKTRKVATSPEIEAKRAKIAELTERRDNIRELIQPTQQPEKAVREAMTPAQKESARLDREIERIEKQIAERAPFTATRKEGEKADVNEGKRRLLELLKTQRENLRAELQTPADPATPEEKRLKSFKTRAENAIAELERRLEENDFSERPKPSPLELDDRARLLESRLELAKLEYEQALERDKYERLSPAAKLGVQAMAVYDSGRNLMTTGELSFILRQGLLAAASRPKNAIAALPDTFKALLADRETAHAINLKTLDDPLANTARAAGLFLPKQGAVLKKQEEMMMGRWAETLSIKNIPVLKDIPGVNKIPLVAEFNQAATTYLNRLRLDSWKAIRESIPVPTAKTDKDIAAYVNHATGRGTGRILDNNAVFLGRTFFSARYLASRFQYFAGASVWRADPAARKALAKEYARTLVGLGVYYGLIAGSYALFRDDDEGDEPEVTLDPRSSDFGKIRFGDKRIDPLAGLSQAIVFTSRTITQTTVNREGGERAFTSRDAVFFFRTKANPVLGTFWDLSPMVRGESPEDIMGRESTVMKELLDLIYPITYADMVDALKNQDVEEGTADVLMMFLGLGIQNADKP